jgi:MarR family transcriptional regulator, organic hydroperoxide resistance regulator
LASRLARVSDQLVPGFEFPTQAHELWALVAESFHGWQVRLHQAATAAGISPVSAWALVQLDPGHPISQKELSARLHCNPSTVVDPTDRLEEAGLIARKANPDDRRVNVLVITPRGRRTRQKLLDRLYQPPEALSSLPARDVARFRDAMRAVVTQASEA